MDKPWEFEFLNLSEGRKIFLFIANHVNQILLKELLLQEKPFKFWLNLNPNMNMILKDHNYCFNETGMETERLNVGKASAEKKYNVI